MSESNISNKFTALIRVPYILFIAYLPYHTEIIEFHCFLNHSSRIGNLIQKIASVITTDTFLDIIKGCDALEQL